MTSAYGYSATAASNNASAPDGAPEAMPPSGVNDTMRKMMANLAEVIFMGVAGGTADALTLTPTNSVVAYVDGMKVSFRASATNTLTNPTLAISGLTARTIVKDGGSALAAGDIVNLGAYSVQYNLANTRWELMNPKQQSVSLASTTEVLTGTDTAKAVTSDALAALWEQGSDVASAGTISLGEGGYFNITGTTTITDIDFATDKTGRKAWVKFAGALTLTHNATTLILPTGANITTAAGDTACFVSEGSDAVRCVAYNRASGASLSITSGIVQRVITSTAAASTATTQIPYDDTIPQNTEGTQILSQAITPTNSSNRLRFTIQLNLGADGGTLIVALFQDSTANALAAWVHPKQSNGVMFTGVFSFEMAAGTTSSTTFNVRVGPQSAATVTVNGDGGARKLGGVAVSHMIIDEIKP